MQVQVVAGGKHHTPAALYPGKSPGILCSGGWMCLRDNLEGYGEKICPNRVSSFGLSSSWGISTPTTLSVSPYDFKKQNVKL